jgi:hypothetical protein
MKGARAVGFALACALAACAGPAAEPAAPAAAPAAAAAAPLSPERARLERWKQQQDAGDPREGFARAAEAEAERRRSEAIARGPSPGANPLEAEMRAQQLEELSAWTGGCFAHEPDFSVQDDWIRHRRLTRDDFRETEPVEVESEVWMPGATTEAYVRIALACVVSTRVEEKEGGLFTAELVDVRFFSMLSRDGSWWNPEALTNPEWILRHEQLHFDVAELFAEEQNADVAHVREATREERDDPEAAAYALRAHLARYLAEQQAAFEAVEKRYDRETRHGNDVERQTEWFARVKRGLAAVRSES